MNRNVFFENLFPIRNSLHNVCKISAVETLLSSWESIENKKSALVSNIFNVPPAVSLPYVVHIRLLTVLRRLCVWVTVRRKEEEDGKRMNRPLRARCDTLSHEARMGINREMQKVGPRWNWEREHGEKAASSLVLWCLPVLSHSEDDSIESCRSHWNGLDEHKKVF